MHTETAAVFSVFSEFIINQAVTVVEPSPDVSVITDQDELRQPASI